MSQHPLANRTMVASGGSRSIGLAIGLGAAKLGANVVLLAKTSEPHPKLPGTAVTEVEAAGGKGLAVVGDVRKEEDVQRAVDAAVDRFGGIEIVVNNASAISTDSTEQLSAKKFDLMMDIMADAAVGILTRPAADTNGQTYLDTDLLAAAGVTDLAPYGGGDDPMWDIVVGES